MEAGRWEGGGHEHGMRESKEAAMSGQLGDSCVYENQGEWNADFGRKAPHVGPGSRGWEEVRSKHSNTDLVMCCRWIYPTLMLKGSFLASTLRTANAAD